MKDVCIFSDESSSEEEEDQVNALDSPLVRRQVKGKMVEGVNGIYEGSWLIILLLFITISSFYL